MPCEQPIRRVPEWSNQEDGYHRPRWSKASKAAGIEPASELSSGGTEPAQVRAKPKQINALPDSVASTSEQNRALPEQNSDRSVHQKCVPSVHLDNPGMPDDLAQVVVAWDSLPEVLKAGILAMVEAARAE